MESRGRVLGYSFTSLRNDVNVQQPGLILRVERPTAPRPVTWMRHKFFSHRISLHVVQFLLRLGAQIHIAVVIPQAGATPFVRRNDPGVRCGCRIPLAFGLSKGAGVDVSFRMISHLLSGFALPLTHRCESRLPCPLRNATNCSRANPVDGGPVFAAPDCGACNRVSRAIFRCSTRCSRRSAAARRPEPPRPCHPDRRDPAFSFAPQWGAPGHGVEGSPQPIIFTSHDGTISSPSKLSLSAGP